MVNIITDETILFYGGYLDRHIEETMSNLRDRINDMSEENFSGSSDDELCEELFKTWQFIPPIIDEDGIDIAKHWETKVDVSGDKNRDIRDRSKPFYIAGHAYTFAIPYSGDKKYFYLRGSTGTINHPRGTIKDGAIHITIESTDNEQTTVRRDFDRQLTLIKTFLPSVQQGIRTYNSNLPSAISNFISQRRQRLERVDETIKSIGYPIRRKKNVYTPFKIPQSKSSIRIEKRKNRKSKTTPERPTEKAISMEDFDSILSDIEIMAKVIEQSPSAFREMDEESLRWLFMIPLNLQYDSATAETFNYKGKTDILIREGRNNIFIAECKIWRGATSFRKAIDQVLGYTTWRDTKIALLIFNKETRLSTVIKSVKKEVPKHDCYVVELEPKGDTHFRYTFHHIGDEHKLIDVAVLIFDIPKSITGRMQES